jgi:threonine/homoserine/homoserine lactone efflux protein
MAAFALISLVLIIVPGPNVLFLVSRSVMLGRGAEKRPR